MFSGHVWSLTLNMHFFGKVSLSEVVWMKWDSSPVISNIHMSISKYGYMDTFTLYTYICMMYAYVCTYICRNRHIYTCTYTSVLD